MPSHKAGKRCHRVSIDKALASTGANWKHADVLYMSNNRGVVLEETGRPEHRDIEKVRETIARGVPGYGNVRIIAGIVHYRRGNAMFNRMISYEQKQRPPIFPANCEENSVTCCYSFLDANAEGEAESRTSGTRCRVIRYKVRKIQR